MSVNSRRDWEKHEGRQLIISIVQQISNISNFCGTTKLICL